MKSFRLHLILSFPALLVTLAQAHDKNAPLNDEQTAFLAQYEAVRAALAADDLLAVRKAAAAVVIDPKARSAKSLMAKQTAHGDLFVATVKNIATADSLATARDAFKALSKRAIHYAEGKPGYYVAHCSMVANDGGNWVQVSKSISNPYFGKDMLTCGSIK